MGLCFLYGNMGAIGYADILEDTMVPFIEEQYPHGRFRRTVAVDELIRKTKFYNNLTTQQREKGNVEVDELCIMSLASPDHQPIEGV